MAALGMKYGLVIQMRCRARANAWVKRNEIGERLRSGPESMIWTEKGPHAPGVGRGK